MYSFDDDDGDGVIEPDGKRVIVGTPDSKGIV